ncbi:unnamed protein product [Urochloa humidicola]
MANLGGGTIGDGNDRTNREQENPNLSVADLMQKLHLTIEEGNVADFNDGEAEGEAAAVEWALLGKVLSPSTLHANTIRSTMVPVWGNPHGLKIRSIGERGNNLFVANLATRRTWSKLWLVPRGSLVNTR